MRAVAVSLRFQIGARTLMAVQRQLIRVPLSLDEALAGRLPMLPPLHRAAHGYAITSLPADRRSAMAFAGGGMIAFVRQRYTRHFIDLRGGFDAYFNGLSANARSGLRRKTRKLTQLSGGTLDIRRFRTPAEICIFHDIARQISLKTYQERLMGAGLPNDDQFLRAMHALAAADRLRAWLLYVGGEPAAYLYTPIQGGVVRYDHVGHDPAFSDLSPGGVLQLEALRDLFAEDTLSRFDFTEGDGQHKRQFATGGVECVDLLLLRASLANRMTTMALGGIDRVAATGKQVTQQLGLHGLSRKLRR